MTDIIKFNEEHTPKTAIEKMKFELAEALNTITDLQNGYKFPKMTATERHKKFNKAMITVCDILGIDLDMHELMKTGSEDFSYSDTEDDTKPLENLLSDKQSYDIKTKLFNLFTIISGLSHSDTDFIAVDDKGVETPATQQELAKALRTNLVELTDSLGYSVDEVTESQSVEQEEPQKSVKSIIEDLKELTSRPYAYVGNDVDSLGDIIAHTLEDLYEALGIELEEGATPVKTKDQETYDNLPAEDKLNVDMLNKLHEVQDHVLKSGQDAVSMNQVQTAISILEGSLGVIDHEEE
jgi:hypothetical protein